MASRLVKLSLECVGREYPNKQGHLLSSDEDLRPPRQVPPAFFGIYLFSGAGL